MDSNPKALAKSIVASQPPAVRGITDDWIKDLPFEFSDINAGVLDELMSIIPRYFKVVEIAAAKHPKAIQLLKELEYRERFSLLADGNNNLDQTLVEHLDVRESFVSNLTALVLVLSKGIKLYKLEHQQSLLKDTNRVVEQASQIAFDYLNLPTSNQPDNIIGFLNATKTEIGSRLKNLYDLLPTAGHLDKGLDDLEPRQFKDIGHKEFKLVGQNISVKSGQRIRRSRSTNSPPSGSSSTSHSARSSGRTFLRPSKSSAKKSYGSSGLNTSISSNPSDDGAHNGVSLHNDNTGFESSSKVSMRSSDHIDLNSTRASSRCERCKTILHDPQGLENHSCRTSSIRRFLRQLRSKIPGISTKVPDVLNVRLWHRDYGHDKFYTALFDTGTTMNFISEAVVNQLELDTIPISPTDHNVLGGRVQVSKAAIPKWGFEGSSKMYQDYNFHIVDQIPGGIDVLLGQYTMSTLGISLRTRKALVAHMNPVLSPLDQQEQQQQRERQACANTASEEKIRRRIEAEHAKVRQHKATANAEKSIRPGYPVSMKDEIRSDDHRR